MKRATLFLVVMLSGLFLLVLAAPALACPPGGDCGNCPHAAPPAPPADKPAATPAPTAFDKMPAVGTKATCPVSKKEFTVAKDTPSSQYSGKTYVFCCAGCKPTFDKDPAKYTK